MKKITVLPYGPCIGVSKAINKIENLNSKNISYKVLSPIIHNQSLSYNEATNPSFLVIPAHGYNIKLNDNIIDLTCPFLINVYSKIENYQFLGYEIILIGDPLHQEIKTMLSKYHCLIYFDDIIIDENKKYVVLNQSTILKSNLQDIYNKFKKYPNILIENTTCRIITNRIKKLKDLSSKNYALYFITSTTSNNGLQMFNYLKKYYDCAYLITDIDSFDYNIYPGKVILGSSTSTTDEQIKKVKSILLDLDKFDHQ